MVSDRKKNKNNLLWISVMSFCWSCSTIMVVSVLPIYYTKVLGFSKSSMGMMEGVAISLSFLTKLLSGIFSDWLLSRKMPILIGTMLTVGIRSLFAVATTEKALFSGRCFDRFGKGIRSAPTDALLADISDEKERGKGFGLRHAIYSLGSVVGAILSITIMKSTHNNFQFLFKSATLVAFFSLIILIFKVKDHRPKVNKELQKTKKNYFYNFVRNLKEFPISFWPFLVMIFFLMLTRLSEMFLNLRANDIGISIEYVPIIIIVMDIIHSLVAYPLGMLSDKFNRYYVLLGTMIFLIAANIMAMYSDTRIAFWGSVVFFGLHMGASHGIIKTLTVSSISYHVRGTAFALFYLVSGMAIFCANSIGGLLADKYGTTAPFNFGLLFSIVSTLLIIINIKFLKIKWNSSN